ncbi:cytochrome b [Rhodoligotrophos defluvii]|uniref:cytochrome b n=1 Tax=Rhodoligotrophos defluvii TaxID=2561934 RepID=UPI001EF14E25|nr:cytochrome b [Rhodoligotrophos defluvii]
MSTIPAQTKVERFHPALRALHWIVALLVLIVLPAGILIKFMTEDDKPAFYLVHESLGFLILWFMLARVAVRMSHPIPAEVEEPVPAFRALAKTVHISLYVTLILQPIFGFLATNAFGFPLQWFGAVTIPSPIGKSDLAPYLMGVHIFLGYTILALFCLHMGGVIYHQFVRRDSLLQRML